MNAASSSSKLRIRQIRSGIGFNAKQNATLRALGMGRVNRSREIADNPQVRGMLAKIPHLVVIESERA